MYFCVQHKCCIANPSMASKSNVDDEAALTKRSKRGCCSCSSPMDLPVDASVCAEPAAFSASGSRPLWPASALASSCVRLRKTERSAQRMTPKSRPDLRPGAGAEAAAQTVRSSSWRAHREENEPIMSSDNERALSASASSGSPPQAFAGALGSALELISTDVCSSQIPCKKADYGVRNRIFVCTRTVLSKS